MRVTEDARRCAVFLGYEDPNDPRDLREVEGTGFFVAHEHQAYLVTAAHVARTLSAAPFAVRLTGKDGYGHVHEIERPNWHYYYDESKGDVDVAVMLVEAPDWTLTTMLPSSEFAADRTIKEWEIGPGDAVYLAGMFHLHRGRMGNLVTVHVGHIALMPGEESIPVKGGGMVNDVYLVEAHALPGTSGSPVVVRPTESLVSAEARDILLGVWIAAWPGTPDRALSKALRISKETWIPVGMGMVVPAQRIMDILSRDDVAAERRKMEETEREARAATLLFRRDAKSV